MFDAANHLDLAPHCSLSTRGALVFFGSVCLPTFGVAGMATALGFWPVLPFAGAEMLLSRVRQNRSQVQRLTER